MKISLKNDHRDREKTNTSQVFEANLTKRLENKYEQRSYAERWRLVRLSALLLSYLFNGYSFATGAMAIVLFAIMGGATSTLAISIVAFFAIAVSIGLEWIKRVASTQTFTQGFSTGNFSVSGILGIIALMAVSITLSFSASYFIPQTATAPPTPPKIDDSQEKIIAEAIEHKKEQAAAIKTQREWKGRIGHKDQEEINNLNAQVSKLEGELITHRSAAKAEADKQYRADLKKYRNTVGQNQYILGIVTICTELFFVLCFLYMELYDWKSALERLELENDPKDPLNGPTPTQGQTQYQHYPGAGAQGGGHQAPPTNKRPVVMGFYNRNEDVEDNAVHIPYEPPTETVQQQTEPTETVQNEAVEDNAVHIPYEPPTESVQEEIEDLDSYVAEETNEGIIELVLQKNEKPCEHCGQVMEYKSVRKKYCSETCRWAAYDTRNK